MILRKYYYFAQAGEGGAIKIGHSDDPAQRVRGLNSANPA